MGHVGLLGGWMREAERGNGGDGPDPHATGSSFEIGFPQRASSGTFVNKWLEDRALVSN